jgi:hypothetical protein
MKLSLARVFLPVLAGLLFAAQTASLRAQQWKTYSFPADSFTAAFPSEPDQSTKELDTPNGKVEVHSYAIQDGQTVLLVGVFGYKNGLSGRDPVAVLEAGKQGILSSVNAKSGQEKSIALGSHPGIEFTAESDTARMTVRIYAVNNTIYQLIVVAADKRPYAGTQQFLESFQLGAIPSR